jgi:hypothetical protein
MTPRFATTHWVALRPIASTALRSLGLVAIATILIFVLLPAALGAAGT